MNGENKLRLPVLKTVLRRYLTVAGVLAGFCLSVAFGGCGAKEEKAVETALRESEKGPEELVEEEATDGLPASMKLISIPGGTFSMGSMVSDTGDDESPVNTVTVDGFKLSETEVTFAQYVEFLNEVQPSGSYRKKLVQTNNEDITSHIYYSGGEYHVDAGWGDHPAVNVSWYGAEAFCEHYGMRLPTEAEWEYAAGGPNHYKYPWGDEFDGKACCYSSYNGSGDPPTMSVKSFKPNGYGLYDMAGNVWEWCSDWYDGDYYSKSPSKNPQGPSTGDYRVFRGGSWASFAQSVRCADRGYCWPEGLGFNAGFRVAGD